jgi:hypothetical protein
MISFRYMSDTLKVSWEKGKLKKKFKKVGLFERLNAC